ncbi:transcription factor e(y)2-domain-containing protein [Scleroderma yunnanense]
MSKLGPDSDALYEQVHRRMVESGEWDRILRVLSNRLSEQGWSGSVHDRAKERARTMDPPFFQTILEEVSRYAQATVPPAVKDEVTKKIREFVQAQFER